MAKANRWFGEGNMEHSKMGLYKIPIADRKKFTGSNLRKWVSKKEYMRYVRLKRSGKL